MLRDASNTHGRTEEWQVDGPAGLPNCFCGAALLSEHRPSTTALKLARDPARGISAVAVGPKFLQRDASEGPA